jgi:hypothetical protein
MSTLSLFVLIFTLVAIVLVAIFLFIEKWLKHREREWAFVLRQDNNKAMAPLRVAAYERLIIMLERIAPTSLVMRQNVAGNSAAMLQLECIRAIREEFEHNVSLQVYVSLDCWEKIKRAKEETTELLKVAYTRVSPDSSGMELSREIFTLEAAVGNSAIKDAMLSLRSEMNKYF